MLIPLCSLYYLSPAHRGRLEGGSTSISPPHTVVTKTTLSHPFALEEAYSSADLDLPFTHKVGQAAGFANLQGCAPYTPHLKHVKKVFYMSGGAGSWRALALQDGWQRAADVWFELSGRTRNRSGHKGIRSKPTVLVF